MNASLRVLALVVVGVVLAVSLASAGIYFLSDSRLKRTVSVPPETIPISTDITDIQRGQHLASAVAGCVICHGFNMAGNVVLDDRAIGRIVAPNLTRGRGGIGASSRDADLARAIRYGVDGRGRLLLIMPSDAYNYFSDADLGAIVAYIRSLPSIDRALPLSEVRPLGRALFVTDLLQLQPAASIDPSAPRPAPPRRGITPEYGEYLSETAGCPTCHGAGYSGGSIERWPASSVPAANITPAGIGGWSEADFLRLMRTGSRPDGRVLDTFMPWPYYAQMTDDELRAVWRFLQALPPRDTGTW